jgi:RNA polymerase-binding transcription factor DksA
MQVKTCGRRQRNFKAVPNQPIPYPLDYQFTLERTLRSRLGKLRAEGRTRELGRLDEALARLHAKDYGACATCGAVIPFMRLASDPAERYCSACESLKAQRG